MNKGCAMHDIQRLPGLVISPGSEIRYLEVEEKGGFIILYVFIKNIPKGRIPEGVLADEAATIKLPDGRLLGALSYNGDHKGWCNLLEEYASAT
jgi:hypothetical protein